MKKIRSIRKIDNLGRIVIPMDFRKALEIRDWDELSLSLKDNAILIEKAAEFCTFCGGEQNLHSFEGKFICEDCLNQLSKR